MLAASAPMPAADTDDGADVTLIDYKLPEYNKDSNLLEFVVYGKKAETRGVQILLEKVRVEWVDGDIEKIKAVVVTPTAVYDRASKTINGDDEVHFYSDTMDADGVGFDADHEKQLLHIRSKVKVILKQDLQSMQEQKQPHDLGEVPKEEKK